MTIEEVTHMADITPGMSTKEINATLKKYRKVTFRKGEYNLDAPLVLYSSTIVKCEVGVVFYREHKGRMLELYVTPETTKYKGTHDVEWHGGSFMPNDKGNNAEANVISLFHGKNILLSEVGVWGCQGYHSIEINACKNVRVISCACKHQTAKDGGEFREAIQIDFANYDGLKVKNAKSTSPCYDGTHCCEITISGCEIKNCPNGIGTHTVSVDNSYHKAIKISTCNFEDIIGNDIQLFGMKDVNISCSFAHILIGTKTQAHRNDGGKVKLATPRCNKNVTISAANGVTVGVE